MVLDLLPFFVRPPGLSPIRMVAGEWKISIQCISQRLIQLSGRRRRPTLLFLTMANLSLTGPTKDMECWVQVPHLVTFEGSCSLLRWAHHLSSRVGLRSYRGGLGQLGLVSGTVSVSVIDPARDRFDSRLKAVAIWSRL